MKQISLLLILFFTCSAALFAQPKDVAKAEDTLPCFETDGCTLFPDGNYRDCCVAHDKDYYKGGTEKERSRSDARLYRCVKRKKGWQNKIIAPIMWLGVRIGGVRFLPTPFRWGFGKRKKFQKCRLKLKEAKKQSAPTPEKTKSQN